VVIEPGHRGVITKALILALILALVVVLASMMLARCQDGCPPGAVVMNATGTYVCAVNVSDYIPVFASLSLDQYGNSLKVNIKCLTAGGCVVNLTIYDYVNGELNLVDQLLGLSLGEGESWEYTYTQCSGVCVARLSVNGEFLGWYVPVVAEIPTAVGSSLKELASRDPMILVVAGLLVISVPLGWALVREQGLSGLALAGASLLIYLFTLFLTGDTAVSALISVVSAFAGILFMVIQGGQP